ncbi:MAG: hypothetical protein AB7F89_13140, partial [Pirellulaceae bacterium]
GSLPAPLTRRLATSATVIRSGGRKTSDFAFPAHGSLPAPLTHHLATSATVIRSGGRKTSDFAFCLS